MSETTAGSPDPLAQRLHTLAGGLTELVGEAEATWSARHEAAGRDGVPGWRPFEDAFPTFYQFTNRPPR
jgi:hypothetical protein